MPDVVKVGGRELAQLSALWDEIRQVGPCVVVHGGGPAISARGGDSRFYRGRRVTDLETARLAGAVMEEIGAGLAEEARRRGVSVRRVRAGKGGPIPLRPLAPELYGRVGVPRAVDVRTLAAVLAEGVTVLITPTGLDDEGEWLNVNADDMAAHVAASLRSPFLSFTDVPGVLVGGMVRRRLAAEEARRLIEAGDIQGGMVAKVEAALQAVDGGAPFAWIGPLFSETPIRRAKEGVDGTFLGGVPEEVLTS